MRIYLDNCCFNRPYDDQSQVRIRLEAEAKLAIQEKVKSGEIELVWSYMLDFENAANPFEERKENIAEWKDLASQNVSESPELLACANGLQKLGLRSKDCLHLASSIVSESDFFLTTDDGILAKSSDIDEVKVLNPVDFVVENYHGD